MTSVKCNHQPRRAQPGFTLKVLPRLLIHGLRQGFAVALIFLVILWGGWTCTQIVIGQFLPEYAPSLSKSLQRFLNFENENHGDALTFFSAPMFEKATPADRTRQINAIISWLSMKPTPIVILFGDVDVPVILKDNANIRVLTKPPQSKHNHILVSEMFRQAKAKARTNVLVYVSPYTILSPALPHAVRRLRHHFRADFLAVGQSYNVTMSSMQSVFDERFFNSVTEANHLGAPSQLSYLAFSKNVFRKISDFDLVGSLWAQALVHDAIIRDHIVVDITRAVTAITQLPSRTESWSSVQLDTEKEALTQNEILALQRWDLGQTVHARYALLGGDAITDRRDVLKQYTAFVAPTRPLQRGITLCLHGGPEKLNVLQEVLRRWTGPAVVVLYKHSHSMESEHGEVFLNLKRHFKDRVKVVAMEGDALEYPVNVLRNMALVSVNTEYVFGLDADLIPSEGLYEYLVEHYDTLDAQGPTCLTMPAFRDNTPPSPTPVVPRNKAELLAALRAGKIVLFDDWVRPHHAVVDYQKWQRTDANYDVTYQFMYEPYCVLSMRTMPFYDSRFVYYGFDKVQHVYHMYRLGYRFKVLGNHFVVHKSHEPSDWMAARDNGLVDWQSDWFKELMDYYLTNHIP